MTASDDHIHARVDELKLQARLISAIARELEHDRVGSFWQRVERALRKLENVPVDRI